MSREQTAELRRLSGIHFALTELCLFLDTHPDNEDALDMHKQYSEKYADLLKQYESKYGSIQSGKLSGSNSWSWIKGPWPWESTKEGVL